MRDYTKYSILDIIHSEINYYKSQDRIINSITLGKRDFDFFRKSVKHFCYTNDNSIIYSGYMIRCAKKAINLIRVNTARQLYTLSCLDSFPDYAKIFDQDWVKVMWKDFFNSCQNPLTSQEKVTNITKS
jgi:hypothetical protein